MSEYRIGTCKVCGRQRNWRLVDRIVFVLMSGRQATIYVHPDCKVTAKDLAGLWRRSLVPYRSMTRRDEGWRKNMTLHVKDVPLGILSRTPFNVEGEVLVLAGGRMG